MVEHQTIEESSTFFAGAFKRDSCTYSDCPALAPNILHAISPATQSTSMRTSTAQAVRITFRSRAKKQSATKQSTSLLSDDATTLQLRRYTHGRIPHLNDERTCSVGTSEFVSIRKACLTIDRATDIRKGTRTPRRKSTPCTD